MVYAYKQAVNPVTGDVYSYEEIGAILGVTRQAAFQFAGHTAGKCPSCLRPLAKIKLPKTK